ncbi:MAG: L-serine ammonia-lyase, iron-sulfur-dependent, subunit alpha [Coriobacteriales bacterium]|nr:L-serine ammonia-lyase, iron-sulfur-dependent, subunit alpha [Coriobacteriales bacterium]
MDEKSYFAHVTILRDELVCALGCTEPIAVAYVSALARAALGREPEHLAVQCSGNIVKNVKSVTVPNSGGQRGIEVAATLGAIGGDETRALEVLQSVTEGDRQRCRELVSAGYCSISLAQGVPNLYIRVVATARGHEAVACVRDRHTNVTELTFDGAPTHAHAIVATPCDGPGAGDVAGTGEATQEYTGDWPLSLASIWEFAHGMQLEDVCEVIGRQIDLNEAIAVEGLSGRWGANIGRTLLSTRPNDITCRVRALAAAGSDARMSGCPLPVVICCGSGNQGITCSQPVVEWGRELGRPKNDIMRAVALSDLVAIHTKHFIGELSAFCGAVSAACGAGAAIAWLRGATFEQYQATIVNTLANVGGIVCDGAKPSCAAKIASAVDAAVLGCDMALLGNSLHSGDGLVAADPEQTIRSMGYVGRVGMRMTDVEILNLMTGKTCV